MYKIYQITSGDTLRSIANKIGTTIELLSQINGISQNTQLMPGMNLIIPVLENEMFMKHIVKNGDSIYELANMYNIDYKDILKINGLNEYDYIYEGQEILIPKNGINYYITNEEDTLKKISNKTGTSINELIDNNENIYLVPDQIIVYKKERNF